VSWNVTAELANPGFPQRCFARAASTRRPGRSSVRSFRKHHKALNRRVPPRPSLRSSLVVSHLAVVDPPGDCNHLISAGKAVLVTVACPRQRTRIGILFDSSEVRRSEDSLAVVRAPPQQWSERTRQGQQPRRLASLPESDGLPPDPTPRPTGRPSGRTAPVAQTERQNRSGSRYGAIRSARCVSRSRSRCGCRGRARICGR
jgi:hypothetical protein